MKKIYTFLFLLCWSLCASATEIYQQGEVQGFLLRLAPNSWVTKSLDGLAAYGWVRFIEARPLIGCTGYPWCTQLYRHCLIGRISGDPDVVAQITVVSSAKEGDGTIRDIVLPDGRWFKTNGINLDQAAKDWCMG